MKRILIGLCSLTLILAPLTFSGCATGKGRYNPTTLTYDAQAAADSAVVSAQATGRVAQDIFDLFMQFEAANRAELWKVSPEIKRQADMIRKNGKSWLDRLDKAIEDYQRLRTPENRMTIAAALSLVQNAMAEANKYMAQNQGK